MQSKWMLARWSLILVLVWPLTLVLGLIDTLRHTVLEEPLDYRARKLEIAGQCISLASQACRLRQYLVHDYWMPDRSILKYL